MVTQSVLPHAAQRNRHRVRYLRALLSESCFWLASRVTSDVRFSPDRLDLLDPKYKTKNSCVYLISSGAKCLGDSFFLQGHK